MATFLVAFPEGCWRIFYDGNWYGSYTSRRSAEKASIDLAQSYGEMPSRVVIEQRDGSVMLLWEPVPTGTPAKRLN